MNREEKMKAVVLLSGGLDSATTLAMAKSRDGCECHCLSFDYGQRHRVELRSAVDVAKSLGATGHHIVDLCSLGTLQASALTPNGPPVPKHRTEEQMGDSIPVTYVPARNTVMLAHALAYAEVVEAARIYIGVNAVDYSGYPDCRPEYIRAFQALADLATKRAVEGNCVEIMTPLILMSKAEIIRRGVQLKVDYSLTLSCYDPDSTGAACGGCDSCQTRRMGFEDARIQDPTVYQEVTA